jgi:hypothetical protein
MVAMIERAISPYEVEVSWADQTRWVAIRKGLRSVSDANAAKGIADDEVSFNMEILEAASRATTTTGAMDVDEQPAAVIPGEGVRDEAKTTTMEAEPTRRSTRASLKTEKSRLVDDVEDAGDDGLFGVGDESGDDGDEGEGDGDDGDDGEDDDDDDDDDDDEVAGEDEQVGEVEKLKVEKGLRERESSLYQAFEANSKHALWEQAVRLKSFPVFVFLNYCLSAISVVRASGSVSDPSFVWMASSRLTRSVSRALSFVSHVREALRRSSRAIGEGL